MQTFEASASRKKQFWILLGCCAFILLAGAAGVASEPPKHSGELIVLLAFFLTFGGFLALTVRVVGAETWALYSLGEDGLKKTTWLGTEEAQWSEIAAYQTSWAEGKPNYRLRLANGKSLKIPLCYLGEKASEMNALLLLRLEPVTQRMRERVEREGVVLHPHRKITCPLSLLCSAFFLLISLLPSAPPKHPEQDRIALVLFQLLGVAGVVGAYWLYRWTIRVDGRSIALEAPFIRKRIEFCDIVAIDVAKSEHTARSLKTAIALPTLAENSPFLAHFIFDRSLSMNRPEHPASPQNPEERKARQRSQYALLASVLAISLCASGYGLFLGARALHSERNLDANSQPVNGRITEIDNSIVRYSYAVQNIEYAGKSPVIPKDAAALQVGNPIRLEYLPDSPQVSRAAISNRKGRAYAMLFSATILIVATSYLVIATVRKSRQARL